MFNRKNPTHIGLKWHDRKLWMTMPNMKIKTSETRCQNGYEQTLGVGWIIPALFSLFVLYMELFGATEGNTWIGATVVLGNWIAWYIMECHGFSQRLTLTARYFGNDENTKLLDSKIMKYTFTLLGFVVVYAGIALYCIIV